jgi:Ca-activated chloride channel family protein
VIELAFPWALLLLPAPILVWWIVPPHRERMHALRVPFFRRIADAIGEEPRAGSIVLRRRIFEMLLVSLVWTALVVALARPERVGAPIEETKAARDVILAIDISGSMDEVDFLAADGSALQRLEGVKRVVGRFIEEREGDRVALIVFGEKAFVQSPFTEDLRTVRELLEDTEVGMAGPHTVIGDAIGLAIRVFETSEIEERLLIVLSDGADTGSKMSPVNAAEIAAENGVVIYTVGVGDPQGEGDRKVDVQALEDIATRAGGRFFFADDEAGLEGVYARIDQMSPRKIETISFRPRHALGVLPLGSAALIGLMGATWIHFRTIWRASL